MGRGEAAGIQGAFRKSFRKSFRKALYFIMFMKHSLYKAIAGSSGAVCVVIDGLVSKWKDRVCTPGICPDFITALSFWSSDMADTVLGSAAAPLEDRIIPGSHG